MLTTVVLFFLVVSITSGQVCSPWQYQQDVYGQVEQFGQDLSGQVEYQNFVLYSKLYIDYKGMRSAVVEQLYQNDALYTTVKFIYDDKKNILYVIHPVTEKCAAWPYLGPLLKRPCSDNPLLEYVGTMTLKDVVLDTYRFTSIFGNLLANSTITLERSTFTPVYDIVIGQYLKDPPGNRLFEALQYGNTTMGISDPSVFEIPPYCSTEEPIENLPQNHPYTMMHGFGSKAQ